MNIFLVFIFIYYLFSGPTLRSIGPALVFGAKALSVGLKVGKFASGKNKTTYFFISIFIFLFFVFLGLPLPTSIPGIEELENLLESYIEYDLITLLFYYYIIILFLFLAL